MASSKAAIALAVIFILIMSTAHLPAGISIPKLSAQVIPSVPSFIQLGYGPSSLSSLPDGIPVYTSGDSIWILSNSTLLASVQLISPKGDIVASRTISPFAAYQLYRYSSSDSEGNWILREVLRNSTTISIAIPFVNLSSQEMSANLLNYSMKSGELGMEFAISGGQAFDLQACLASSDVNSTVIIPTPEGVGGGSIILNSNLASANLSSSGSLTSPFSFWFDMVYSYSYKGGVDGELISREIVASSSSTVYFSPSVNAATVALSNETNPRAGIYKLNAYFESSAGLNVEQTSVLVLRDGDFVWMGGCNASPVSSLLFNREAIISHSPQAWPRTLYLSYNVAGVYSYAVSPINMNGSRIDIVSSMALPSTNILHLGNQAGNLFSYLNFSIAPNSNILSYEIYNDSVYIIGRSFPIYVQIDPTFGGQGLQPLSTEISQSYTVTQVSIQVGRLAVQITNNSSPVSGAKVIVQNHFGGTTTAVSDPAGVADFYLPAGSYNVTVVAQGHSSTKAATLEANSQSNVQFVFTSPSSQDLIAYVLFSLVIVGLVLNVWLWLIKPRR